MRSMHAGLCLLGLFGFAARGEARPEAGKYSKEQIQADEKLAREVFARLVARMQPVKGYQWPPTLTFVQDRIINAFAGADWDDKDKEGRPRARVWLHLGFTREVIQGNADTMALILGHELGHIHYRHAFRDPIKTEFERYAVTRVQEAEADTFGSELMLKADYSLKKALAALRKGLDDEKRRNHFEQRHLSKEDALATTHPAWVERFERIAKDKRSWRAMSAFASGVQFLIAEHYALAIECFDRIVEEFPRSHEAWVNRGYAYLMLYCDALEPSDVKEFGVGQVLPGGGFYPRPKFLQPQVRGRIEKYWDAAVGSLRQALKLKSDLPLAKANLALAYLFHKSGKPNIDQATSLFEEALEGLAADKTVDPATRASLLVNFGVALLAEGTKTARTRGLKELDQAIALARKLSRDDAEPITSAVRYQRALVRAASGEASDRKAAVGLLENYLSNSDSLSAWWSLAFDRYVRLCKDAGVTPKKKDDLLRVTASLLRPAISLDLPDGKKVTLAEPIADVMKHLGPASETRAAGNLKRLSFAKYNIEILATDQVLAIVLTSTKAPALALAARGTASREVGKLKIGMLRKDVVKLLGETPFDRKLLESGPEYDYYRSIGLGLRYRTVSEQSVLAEVVLARVPSPEPKKKPD